MIIRKYFILFVLFISVTESYSQTSRVSSQFWSQVRFGGSIGLGFVNNGFNGSISPSALYQIDNQLGVGTSLNFNYAKFNDQKLIAYGGSAFSLFNPIPELQASIEFEQLRINRSITSQTINIQDNYWLPALFVGLGYSTNNVTFGLRYDLLYNEEKSIYGNALLPFVRVFF